MLAIKARINPDSVFRTRYPNDNDTDEKIDKLPRGTAFHAARSPVTNKIVRSSTVSKQLTSPPLDTTNSISNTSTTNRLSCHDNIDTPIGKTSFNVDLAKRAAYRVHVWKKIEQERHDEEEKARQIKREEDKRREKCAAHAKQRRRAKIYALNALLRQVQQDKIARYIAAQKELRASDQVTSLTNALAQVRAVGV